MATVGITQATGGTNISADKASGSAGAAWTALTDIIITSGAANDFTTNTARTLILTAPANFQFQAGVGSASGGGNITSVSVVVTASTVTVTYTPGVNSLSNSLTISGLQVQGTVRVPIAAVNITRTGGTGTIAGLVNTTVVGTLSQVAGTYNKMQLIMPGETAVAGSATGKTGTPTARTAGTAFPMTVNAVDMNWNIITTVTDVVGITSADVNATLPANAALVAGTGTFNITLKTAAATTVTATNITDGTKTANTSPSTSVTAGAFTKMQLLLPGETAAPGTASGKTGTPATQIGAVAFMVTVNAVDANWNLVSSTNTIAISSTDGSASFTPTSGAMTAGSRTFSVTLRTLGNTSTITATNTTNGAITANTSPAVTVTAGAFAKLQLLMPGETAAPGTATGKTGTPTGTVAGNSVSVTVNAVDANWYLINSVTDVVGITSSDANATLPANAALVAGTGTFNVTLKTVGSRTITATDITDGTKTANTGAATTVTAGAFTKLLILLPGETAAPGTATGKTGVVTTQTGNVQFAVTVSAVDANWNLVTSATDNVAITSSDGSATLPANNTLTTTPRSFNITLRTLGAQTITATDVTDGTKTASVSSSVTVATAAFTKMQILLPGETAAPGTTTGKTGTPTAPVAGTPFNVIVNAVDANWYVVPSTDVVSVTSTDANAVLPANTALTAGTVTLSVTLKTGGGRTLTASDVTVAKTVNTSPSVTVGVAAFSQLQVLMPGETAAPGTATGKTGTPSARSAGTSFNVTVNAVDAYWNKVTTVTDVVKITSNDPNAVLPANAALASGTKTNFAVRLRAITTTATVTATDFTDGTKSTNTGSNTVVNAGAYSTLQLLLPGETAAPGTATGKTGTPTVPVAGTPFNIVVNAVDAAYNVVTSATNTVKFTSTDVNAVLPANASLVSGTTTQSFTFKTSGTRTITATDVVSTTKRSTSPNLAVTAGAFVKLQIILPGETAAPGTATGKTGTPTAQNAGTAFATVRVNAVDADWNRVTTVTDVVGLTTTDPNAVVTANTALAAGTKGNFSVNLKTPGTHTVTATDITDAGKTASVSASVAVSLGGFAKLQLLLPGETAAPGTATGKTGTPTMPVAGTPFNVTVNAVDAAWNPVTTATDVVSITSNDVNAVLPANAALVSGTRTFSVTLKTYVAAGRTITASDVTNGSKSPNTSPAVVISPGVYTQLQLLLPGETAAPGTVTGKTGAANPPARGTSFTVVVNAVDAYWNRVTSVTNTVGFSSSDGLATLPAAAALAAGTRTYTNGVRIVDPSSSPLATLTVTEGAKTRTVNVPLGITPTAATDYFRSKSSGNWNNAVTWESSTDNLNWQDATITPTNLANITTIQATHVVTVTASVTADQIVVQTDGQLVVNSGFTLTVQSGGADVSGTVTNAGVITPTGTVNFLSGGKYQHNYTTTAGTIPAATWNNTSTCEIIGYTSATGTVGGGAQTFGHFIWNCPNQNVSGNGVSLVSNTTASVNDLTINATGTGVFPLATTGGTVNVRGNFTLNGGIVVLGLTSNTNNLNVAGNFTIAGGTLRKGSGSNLVSFNGTTQQNYVKTGGTIEATAINFAVNSGTIVDFGTSIIDGSTGNFTLNAGGTILTDNDNGFGTGGSIQLSGTKNFGTAGNFVFEGTNAQLVGTGLPSTINNLTINNSQGVTMPSGSTFTINGQLNLMDGDLDMSTSALIVGPSFTSTGSGTLKTANTSSAPITTGKTWTVGIEYNAPDPQTVVAGTYTNLSFSEAGTKTTAAGTINVTGNWSSADGKIDLATNSTVLQFNGTNQSLNDGGSDNGIGVSMPNVTFAGSGTKILSSGTFLIPSGGLLTMAGTATLNANSNLVIASDASGSGSVAPVPTGTSITGAVDVQRFMTGGGNLINRGYRLLSSPVSHADAPNRSHAFTYLKGSGTYITGPGGASSGFDVAGGQTIYVYRDDKVPSDASFVAGNFRGINAINNDTTYIVTTSDGKYEMPVGNGFMFFFRGNEGTVSSVPPEDVVLNNVGVLNQGQIVVKPWFKFPSDSLSFSTVTGTTSVQGFNLVGNPYASSIDWHKAYGNNSSTTGIYAPDTENSIYIYNATTKNYSVYTSTSSSTGVASGAPGGSNIIPSGQGFFVRATANTAKLTFNESAKVNAQVSGSNLLLGTPVNAGIEQYLRLQMAKDDINKDEMVVMFNKSASNAFNRKEDVLYLKGSGVLNLSNFSSDRKQLAINQLALPGEKQSQSIKLNVAATADGIYSLNLTELKNIPDMYDVWLMDAFQKDSLDIKHNRQYNFNIYTRDTASYGANRFTLVIKQNAALGYRLLAFNAVKSVASVQVTWKAENEADHTYFTLERSLDGGNTYDIIASVPSNSLGTYSFLDKTPVAGANKYRLKQEDLNGKVTYSNIETIDLATKNTTNSTVAAITIYPNPTNAMLNVSVNKDAGKSVAYKIDVISNSGKLVHTATASQNTYTGNISSLLPGTYFVQVQDQTNGTLIGKASFIKL